VLADAREILAESGHRDPFDALRDELRRAAWWARSWSLAYLWKSRVAPVRRSRDLLERTTLRATRASISELQSWRVHKHEKQAWARLEELTR